MFINLGAINIVLAFLKVLGEHSNYLGVPYPLMESGVLKKGSTNGFIRGESYNRGKRTHQLLSVLMQILHFREFLKKQCDSFLYLSS